MLIMAEMRPRCYMFTHPLPVSPPSTPVTHHRCMHMQLANQHGLKRIAFPAISCGIYGYPFDEAAEVRSAGGGGWRHRWLAAAAALVPWQLPQPTPKGVFFLPITGWWQHWSDMRWEMCGRCSSARQTSPATPPFPSLLPQPTQSLRSAPYAASLSQIAVRTCQAEAGGLEEVNFCMFEQKALDAWVAAAKGAGLAEEAEEPHGPGSPKEEL